LTSDFGFGGGDIGFGGALKKESFDCVKLGLNLGFCFDDDVDAEAEVEVGWVDGVFGFETLFGLAGSSLDLAFLPKKGHCSASSCFAISAVAASGLGGGPDTMDLGRLELSAIGADGCSLDSSAG
jgi:hypothetical protein